MYKGILLDFNAIRQSYRVSKNPELIKDIINPKEQVQISAVSASLYSIRHIQNPTEKVQKYVLSNDMNCIGLIQNISDNVLTWAIERNPSVIKYIKNPSPEILKTIAIKQPEIFSEYVVDKNTLNILKSINPSIEQYVCKQSHHTLYNALCSRADKFSSVNLTTNQFKDLYYFHLKESNRNYIINISSQERTQADNNMTNLLKGRELDIDIQTELIKDRIGNYCRIHKPDISITSTILKLTTGIDENNSANLKEIEQPLKNLVNKLEKALIRENQPCRTPQDMTEISIYRERHGDIDESEFAQLKSASMIRDAYIEFQGKTGLEFSPEEHNICIKDLLKNIYGYIPGKNNSVSGEIMYRFQKNCNSVMSEIVSNNKAALKQAASTLGIMNFSKEDIKNLYMKGKTIISGKGMVQKIKTPMGYAYKTYSYANQPLANINNMNHQGSAEF